MALAMSIKVGNPARKLVLLKLCDNANDKGECWPSLQHIADQCEISRRTAISHVQSLADDGFLKVENRFKNNEQISNFYIIDLEKKQKVSTVQSENISPPPSENFAPRGGEEISPPSATISPPSENISPHPSENFAHRTSHSFESVNEPVINQELNTVQDIDFEKLNAEIEAEQNAKTEFLKNLDRYFLAAELSDKAIASIQTKLNRFLNFEPLADLPKDFELFYALYPLKVASAQARKAWESVKGQLPPMVDLINLLFAQIANRVVKHGNGLFVPEYKHPATWLRSKAWEDELIWPLGWGESGGSVTQSALALQAPQTIKRLQNF